MIPIKQTKFHIKDSNGKTVQRGNCFAACIASLLMIPITEIPNVETLFHIEGTLWIDVMNEFLLSKGYELNSDFRFSSLHNINDNITDEFLQDMKLKNVRYLASGNTIRGTKHICIYMNGKCIHDPHPSNEGLTTFENFQTLDVI